MGVSASAIRAGRAFVEFFTDDRKLIRGLKSVKRRLDVFSANVRKMGTQLLALGTVAAAPLVRSVAVYSSFDDAVRSVGAVSGATANQLEMLRQKAKQLGATTSYSASQVAELMTELARAGFSPEQIERMTGSVMNLARATGTDATEASGIMAATIRQFGMAAGDATKVADSLTAAANNSFNSVTSLGEALAYAGPVASDANMSLDETLSILGTLGNMGIQGSSAGNALRRLLTLSAAESEKFQEIFGVATKDAQGNARDLVDVLGEIAEATSDLGTADRAAKFSKAFGLLGITSASAISKTTADTRELLKTLQDADGTAQETAESMDAGIGGALRIIMSGLEGVQIALSEALDVSLVSAAKSVSNFLTKVINWINANQETVKTIAGVIAAVLAIGGALVAFSGTVSLISMVVGGLASGLGAIGTLFTFLISPIGLVAAGIALIAAIMGYALYASEDLRNGLLSLFSSAMSYFGGLFSVVNQTIGGIVSALTAGKMELAGTIAMKGLYLAFRQGIHPLLKFWNETMGLFSSTWNEVWAGIQHSVLLIVNQIQKVMARIWGLIDRSVNIELTLQEIDNHKNAGIRQINSRRDRSQDEAFRASHETDAELARLKQDLKQAVAKANEPTEAASDSSGISPESDPIADIQMPQVMTDSSDLAEIAMQNKLNNEELANSIKQAALEAEDYRLRETKEVIDDPFSSIGQAFQQSSHTSATAANDAVEINSSEGVNAVLRALTGDDRQLEQKLMRKQVNHLKEIASNTDSMKGVVLS